MNRYTFGFMLLMALLLFSCENNTEHSEITKNELPQDFLEFYDRFHSDSAFQMEHIEFPLPGLPANANLDKGRTSAFFWQKEDWVIQKFIDEEASGFRREIFMMGETLVVEYMINSFNYRIQRRFSKRNNTWKLSYYEDINLIGSQSQ